MLSRFISKLKKDLTESPFKTVLLTGVLFVLLFLLFYSIYCITFHQFINPVKVFVDMVSPATLRNYTYDTSFDNTFLPASHILYLVVYLSGIVVFSGVFIATLTSFIRSKADMVNRGDTRYKLNGHVLILGYDGRLNGTIKKLTTQSDVVIGVESDVESLRAELRMMLGDQTYKRITFIHANKNDRNALKKKLRVVKAREIFIVGDGEDESHDSANLDCFAKICEVCDTASQKVADCHIYFRDPATFALFQTHAGLKSHKDSFHPFNFDELWARKVLVDFENNYPKLDYRSEQDNITTHPEKNVHFIIMGMSSMGEMLSRVATMIIHYPNFITHGKKTLISFVDPDAHSKMESYTGRYAEFFKLCHFQYCEYTVEGKIVHYDNSSKLTSDFLDVEFEFIKSSYSNIRLQSAIERWSMEDSFMTIAVCEEQPYLGMGIASFLPHIVYEKEIPMFVYQKGEVGVSEFLKGSKYSNMVPFGSSDIDVLNERRLVQWAKELAASWGTGGLSANDYWNTKLSVALQWSNIYNVASLPYKMRAFGISLADGNNSYASLNENQRDLLGQTEHNRWCAEKLMMGYRPTQPHEHEDWVADVAKKNAFKSKFIHDDIRPFSELDTKTQLIDIDLWNTLCMIVEQNNKE